MGFNSGFRGLSGFDDWSGCYPALGEEGVGCEMIVLRNLYKSFSMVELHLSGRWLSRTQIVRIGLALRVKFVENCTKPICLEITGYRNTYDTVLRLLELQIRRD